MRLVRHPQVIQDIVKIADFIAQGNLDASDRFIAATEETFSASQNARAWRYEKIHKSKTFGSQNVAILSHGIIKEQSAVPNIEIEQAITRKKRFVENPEAHTYQGALQGNG